MSPACKHACVHARSCMRETMFGHACVCPCMHLPVHAWTLRCSSSVPERGPCKLLECGAIPAHIGQVRSNAPEFDRSWVDLRRIRAGPELGQHLGSTRCCPNSAKLDQHLPGIVRKSLDVGQSWATDSRPSLAWNRPSSAKSCNRCAARDIARFWTTSAKFAPTSTKVCPNSVKFGVRFPAALARNRPISATCGPEPA